MNTTLYWYSLYIEIFVKYINVNYIVRPNMYKLYKLLQEKEAMSLRKNKLQFYYN